MELISSILGFIVGLLIGGAIICLLRHAPSDIVDLIHWLFEKCKGD